MQLEKPAVDVGVVVSDGPEALAFYRDVLGLEHVADTPFPLGGTIHRLAAGESLVKLVVMDAPVERPADPGPFTGTAGVRYLTFPVADITATLEACVAAGRPVVWPVQEVRPGVWIAMVTDPDGNGVEFLTTTPPRQATDRL